MKITGVLVIPTLSKLIVSDITEEEKCSSSFSRMILTLDVYAHFRPLPLLPVLLLFLLRAKDSLKRLSSDHIIRRMKIFLSLELTQSALRTNRQTER